MMVFCSLSRPCRAILLPGSGNNNNRPKPGRLIIPGSPSFTSSERTAPVKEIVVDGVEGETKRTYRPPMGYFQKAKPVLEISDVSDEVMIQKLSVRSGLWHALAAYLPQLNSHGYDSILIEELTGIPKMEQSIFVTAASVLQSISIHTEEQNSQETGPMFAYFDQEGTHFALYELRFLSTEQRLTCARYIAEKKLHASDARDLARSTKEYYRRGAETTGFLSSPEDILAYKFYRNVILPPGPPATESREAKLIASYVKKGLEIAPSDNAQELLESVLVTEDGSSGGSVGVKVAKIPIHRLLTSETLFRTVPFAGDLFEVESSVLRSCPKMSTAGEFGIFSIDKESIRQQEHTWQWVTLPKWLSIAQAQSPIVFSIRNCAEVEELRLSINVKSKDKALKLGGSGLLVVDTAQKDNMIEGSYYLADDAGKLKLTASEETEGKQILARVLYLARPPNMDSEF